MSAIKRVFSGKSIRDAINKGLQELGVSKDDVKITVLEQPSRGLFGLFGVRKAKVEIEVLEREIPPQPDFMPADEEAHAAQADARKEEDAIERTKAYILEIVSLMGAKADLEQTTDEDGNIVFRLKGNDLGLLIGRRGQTLDALQTLANVYASRCAGGYVRIILDAEHFRERRKKTLEDLSMRLANQVVRTKREVVLEPMTPQERRIIHFKLQNHPRVKTYSKGEEPNRRIVITLKS